MTKLVYTRDEIMADDVYASEHLEAGYKLHGGFDSVGDYVSPRTLNRWPAVRAWQDALKSKGAQLINADTELLKYGNYPTVDQQKFLLQNGFGQTFWNSLTITGVIEARGKLLCEYAAPDLQEVIVEDISETATGHLNKGLLFAHGLDEGGDPESGVGAHDAMWFAARDLLFGKGAYPIPEIPASIGRPVEERDIPQLSEENEALILLLMNVLMIEVRAENFFSFSCQIARDKDVFTDRRADADHAAELVDRIRQDEAIHVAYLQTVVSELRTFTFKTVDGQEIRGEEFIDPTWNRMVEWHSVTNHQNARKQTSENIAKQLLAHANGEALLKSFSSLEVQKAA